MTANDIRQMLARLFAIAIGCLLLTNCEKLHARQGASRVGERWTIVSAGYEDDPSLGREWKLWMLDQKTGTVRLCGYTLDRAAPGLNQIPDRLTCTTPMAP